MSDRWRRAVVEPTASVRHALQAISDGNLQIAFVLDAEGILQGTVTDGDVRRGLLAGATIDDSVQHVMHLDPITASPTDTPDVLAGLMRRKAIRQVPLVDEHRRMVGLHVHEGAFAGIARPNEVILMVGGLGSRLGALTNDRPKPLIHVGRKPILETIVERLADQGFQRFHMAINYRGELIREHFGDGARWGVTIEYIEERERLGTAGALSLLPAAPRDPFLVMNGDILTSLDFVRLIDFHVENRDAATVAVREHSVQVPYGVVSIEGHQVQGIIEKPTIRHFVSAGIYVLDAPCLRHLAPGQPADMPDLIQRVLDAGGRVGSFPVLEYWRDVGRPEDLAIAHAEVTDHLSDPDDDGR